MKFISKRWNVGLVSAGLLGSLSGGCGGESNEFEGAEASDVTATGESINRGTTVGNNNAPFSSVVRLTTTNGTCSAIKIKTNQYLTAAHCLLRTNNCSYVGFANVVEISNALDATAAGTSVTLNNSYIHPSYKNDFDVCDGNPASRYSYDIAIIETNGDPLSSIPFNTFWPGHIPVGTTLRQVGYGVDAFNSSSFKKKQYADYLSATDSDLASLAHTIRTYEDQSAGEGDSGGPLLYQASTGNWRVAGIQSASNGGARDSKRESWFTRVANVGRWINAPHNNSTTNDGTGFLQSLILRQCMSVANSSAGTAPKLAECEGYDPSIHGTLWELVASGTGVQIRTKRNGTTRCLDMQGSTNNVVLANCGTGQGQQWIFTPFLGSTSSRTIKNRLRNLYLTDSSGSLMVTPSTEARWLFYR
jgi:V8-like Glu-specific endopeptidase